MDGQLLKVYGGPEQTDGQEVGWKAVVISAMFSRLSIIALLCTQTQMMIVS